MAGRMSESEIREAAQRWNQELAKSVFGSFCKALCGCLALVVAGWFLYRQRPDVLWLFCFPVWAVALIFLLIAMDDWERWKEVKGRKWVRLTPYIRDKEAPSSAPDQTTQQPAS